MKQLDIVDLQKNEDNYRFLAHSPTEENWPKFRDIRNKSKSKKQNQPPTKNIFQKLSSVHKILKPNDNTLKVDTNKVNISTKLQPGLPHD